MDNSGRDRSIEALVREHDIVRGVVARGTERPVEVIDPSIPGELERYLIDSAPFQLTAAAREQALRIWSSLPPATQLTLEAGVITTAGAVAVAGAVLGDGFPDWDIKFLGIGSHRFWAFHSAAASWLLQEFFESMHSLTHGNERLPAAMKIAAMAAAGGAFGVGVHLAKDGAFGLLDGEKSVAFGLPGVWMRGTAVRGTYLDDDAWLLGNSMWCFKMSHDLAVLAYGSELQRARAWAASQFRGWTYRRVQQS